MKRVDVAVSIAANLAYALIVCAFLWMLFPGLRRRISALAHAAMWNYRLGLWLQSRQPTPGYVQRLLQGGPTAEEPSVRREVDG